MANKWGKDKKFKLDNAAGSLTEITSYCNQSDLQGIKNTLDELTESMRRLEQIPGVLQTVPVYIHEESGLELITTEEFIVKLSTGASLAELEAINEATGTVITRTLSGTTDQFILVLSDCTPEELFSTCELYYQNPAIEWAEPNFLADVQGRLSDSIWQAGGCTSWYQNEQGRNTAIWPGSVLAYRHGARRARLSDYRVS